MFLYHIRRKGMTLEEGYIGVTVNTSKRFSQHIRDARNPKRKSRNYHLYNALRLYDDIEFVIIEEGDDEYILKREFELRPLPDIGWNQAVGGSHNGGCTWKGKSRPEHSELMKSKGFQKGNTIGTNKSVPVEVFGISYRNSEEASKILGVDRKTVYNRCKRGVEGYKFLRDVSSDHI